MICQIRKYSINYFKVHLEAKKHMEPHLIHGAIQPSAQTDINIKLKRYCRRVAENFSSFFAHLVNYIFEFAKFVGLDKKFIQCCRKELLGEDCDNAFIRCSWISAAYLQR